MGKIYQFINSLGRSTTTFRTGNYPNVNNTDRPSPHVEGKFDPDPSWIKVVVDRESLNRSCNFDEA